MEPFASPDHIDPELQSFLQDASDILCEWIATASKAGPLPCSIKTPKIGPEIEGLCKESLLEDLRLIMDGAFHPSNRGSLAHLDPPPLTASIVAELISAGLNNNLLAEELSPTLSKLERKLCKWIAGRIGMPKEAGGVAASGGSLSNLMALVVAKENACLQKDSNAVVLASEDAHVSFLKAMKVMGLGEESFVKVLTDEKGEISIDSLLFNLKRVKKEGRKCFAIIATAGTTVRGAIDPILKIHHICSRENIWLHVDAAIGGVFALNSKTSYLLKGISFANSITFNPQKILGITKTSSLLIVSNRKYLLDTFSTGLPYIEPPWEEPHGGEIGLQGTRPGEVLKLWLGLRQLGEKGIEKLLLDSISRRNYLEGLIDRELFNIITGPLHIMAFTPKHFSLDRSKEWSIYTRTKLLNHQFMLSRPIYNHHYYLKVVLGNPHTTFENLDKLGELINNSYKEFIND